MHDFQTVTDPILMSIQIKKSQTNRSPINLHIWPGKYSNLEVKSTGQIKHNGCIKKIRAQLIKVLLAKDAC